MSEVAGKPTVVSIPLGTGVAAERATSVLGQRNARLQYLRGFAAFAVLIYHAAQYHQQLRGETFLADIFSGVWGAYGVAVFFVLSGYLMAQLSLRDEPHRFLINRVLRIYPLMLVMVVLALAGYFLTGFARRPDLLALTLIPAGPRDYFLGVEWTLLFEMTYYVVIAAMALAGLRRWLEALFVCWLAFIVGITITGMAPTATVTPTLSQLVGQSANIAFILGFLLPRFLDRLPSPLTLCALALPIALAGFWITDAAAMRWPTGLSSMLLVAAALKAAPPPGTGFGHRFGLRLGDASYALYLCHVPIIVLSGNVLSSAIPGTALFVGWIIAALALSLLLAPLDLNLHARLKRWADGLSKAAIARGSVAFLALFIGVSVYADVDARIDQAAENRARAALVANPAKQVPHVLAGLDTTQILGDGRAVLRGYGIDMQKPDEDSHVAIEQGGRIIGFDRMRRMRPKIAIDASRPDLKSYRFGFSVVTGNPLACDKGPLSAKLILSDGRVAEIESEALLAICAPPR